MQRIKIIQRASWIAVIGNAALSFFKIFAGIVSGSLSVTGDGIDSFGDVLIALMTLYITRLLKKPPSVKYPYGYAKAETNATSVLAFIIFFAGAQLLIATIRQITGQVEKPVPDQIGVIAVLVSIIGKLGLSFVQLSAGKKTKSTMLIANGKNMQADIFMSVSVLVGLVATYIFKLPIIDNIAAIIVSLWIIWVAVRIFRETNRQLMDGGVEKEIYHQVFDIIDKVEGVDNPHRLRIRNVGSQRMINIDVEMNGNITLIEAHDKAHTIEEEIKNKIEDVFDVVIHTEPAGYHIEEKDLGIGKEHLD